MYFPLFVGVLCLSLFWYALLCDSSSFAIILKRKRELIALFLLSYVCVCACVRACVRARVCVCNNSKSATRIKNAYILSIQYRTKSRNSGGFRGVLWVLQHPQLSPW